MTTRVARSWTRSRRHRVIGGVCGGLADRLGWSPWAVRAVFVLLTILPLFPGIPVYVVLWLLLPLGD